MSKPKFLDICHKYFYLDKDEAKKELTENQYDKLLRFERTFTMWLDHASWTESQVAKFLMDEYNISRSQAFRDCEDIKFILTSVISAKKEWERHKANTYIDKGMQEAENAKDKLDIARALAMIAAGKAKELVNRLNKLDPDELPFDKIIPPDFEPVYDPSLLESKRKDPEMIKQEVREMYEELGLICDAEIITDK
jgi:hypothetical protein